MELYEDKNCFENSAEFLSGLRCYEKDCENEAGTAWSPYFCVDCNIKRMKRIDKNLKEIQNRCE